MREKALGRAGLSRREVLVGAATTAIVAASPTVLAFKNPEIGDSGGSTGQTSMPAKRFMASAAVLGDGRILLTGGYGRPWQAGSAISPSRSAYLLNPSTGIWTTVAAMNIGRARHSAVSLPDGRVAVVGGMTNLQATASVEVYDPRTNAWTFSSPMGQGRYDHSAVSSGSTIFVIGGSGQSTISKVETLTIRAINSVSY